MQKIISIVFILSLIISGLFITDILEEKDIKETQELTVLSLGCCKSPQTIFKTSGGAIKALILK